MNELTPLIPYFEVVTRLVAAMILGALVGTERTLSHRVAGMRTYALVSLGAAIFVVTGEMVMSLYGGLGDPVRIAAQVVSGVGFLGAGLIMVRGSHISGLTTAAGLWVAAAIGMAAGFGLLGLALIGTLLILFVLVVLRPVEAEIKDQIE